MLKANWSDALGALKSQAHVITRVKAESDLGKAVDRETLDEAFRHIQDSVELAADYPEDGCYARAQLLCDELKDRGIESEKVFVTPFFGQLKTREMSKGWRYHVATVSMTSDQGAQVLDPLLSGEPLPMKEWFGSIWRGGVGMVSVHEPTKYLNGLSFSRNSEKHHADAVRTLSALATHPGRVK